MGRIEKLYQKVKNAPASTKFTDLIKLAESVGLVKKKSKGGGHIYIYKLPETKLLLNFQRISGGQAKKYQVYQLLDAIDEYSLLRED